MDAQFFDSLLYRGESELLDFKVDQYSFERSTDEQKSEVLKDILAFANAWRETDAYILIEVKEIRGAKRRTPSFAASHNQCSNKEI